MDKFADLIARTVQCRRMISNAVDETTLTRLRTMLIELEDRAAAEACEQLAPGAGERPYVISRVAGGWLVSRDGDRLLTRSTLEEARLEALRLTSFDDAAE